MNDLERFKQAWWDYLLEHCEIDHGGALFVKFHTKGRNQLEGHIWARAKGYHREDPRAKEAKHLKAQEIHIETKKNKKEKYKRRMKYVRFKLKTVKYIKSIVALITKHVR